MPSVFDNLDYVERLLRLSPLGLMTDIDGTISFAVPNPWQARVTPVCRRSLDILSGHLELVAAVSGRPVSQMRDMLGLEGIVYVGNHGFERWLEGRVEPLKQAARYTGVIEATLQELKPLTAGGEILLENKGVTASIHYRQCPDLDAARRRIFAALENSASAKDLIIKPGRIAVDLVPPVEANKGSAVRDLIREYGLRAAIYMGDDVSDIDAFRAMNEFGGPGFEGVSIAVINEETLPGVEEGADFSLRGVEETERFLEWFADVVRSE